MIKANQDPGMSHLTRSDIAVVANRGGSLVVGKNTGAAQELTAARQAAWLTLSSPMDQPRNSRDHVPGEYLTENWRQYRASGKSGIRGTLMMLLGSPLDAVIWLRPERTHISADAACY